MCGSISIIIDSIVFDISRNTKILSQMRHVREYYEIVSKVTKETVSKVTKETSRSYWLWVENGIKLHDIDPVVPITHRWKFLLWLHHVLLFLFITIAQLLEKNIKIKQQIQPSGPPK